MFLKSQDVELSKTKEPSIFLLICHSPTGQSKLKVDVNKPALNFLMKFSPVLIDCWCLLNYSTTAQLSAAKTIHLNFGKKMESNIHKTLF